MRSACTLLALTLLSSTALAESLVGAAPPDEAEPPGATRRGGRLVSVPDVPAARDVEPGPDLADRDGDGVADGLAAKLAGAAADERFDVIVAFATPGHAAAARRALGPVDLGHEYDLIPGFSASLTAGQVRALTRMPGVVRVEEVAPVYAFMEAERRDFGVDRAQGPLSAGGLEVDGTGIGICVVDTGVFADQEQLDSKKPIKFADFVGTSVEPYDDQGHGTHVASIAAGDGTAPAGGDQVGAARYRGVAPGASLYAAKVLDANGQGTSAAVIAGVNWCAEQEGVDIINLSLGEAGSSDGADLLSQAVNAAVNQGIVVVVAAGNSGAAPYTIGSPAAATLAITVGAAAEWSASSVSQGESDGLYLAPFSSRGPTADNRVKPDIVAPGVSVIAGYINPLPGFYTCTTNCYASLSGTSMAAPFTAGTVALMLQANPTLSPEDVKSLLFGTTQDRGPGAADGAPAVKDSDWGWGVIDAYAAVAAAAWEPSPTPTAFPAYGIGAGDVVGSAATLVPLPAVTDTTVPLAVTVTILEGEQQRFCDIFLGCFYEWRPDFDVRLRDPNGNTVAEGTCMYGSLFGGECDNVGRQETVHVQTPVLGTYTLEVYKGTSDSANGPFRYEVSQGPVGSPLPPPPNEWPVANAGADQEATDSDGDGLATVTLDGSGSRDPDGSIVAYDWTWSTWSNSGAIIEATLPVGVNTVTLTVTDDRGASASDDVVVTVHSAPANQPPVADAGEDQSVTLSKGRTVSVTLDGTGSSDPDGDSIASWQWSKDGAVIATGATPTVKLAEGSHVISLTVTDSRGATSAPDSVTITVTAGGGGGGGGGSCHPKKGCV